MYLAKTVHLEAIYVFISKLSPNLARGNLVFRSVEVQTGKSEEVGQPETEARPFQSLGDRLLVLEFTGERLPRRRDVVSACQWGGEDRITVRLQPR